MEKILTLSLFCPSHLLKKSSFKANLGLNLLYVIT